MYALLSSDAAQRYIDDIARAIALPIGAHLQFRYKLDLFHAAARSDLVSRRLVDQAALIVFYERVPSISGASLYPVRCASIIEAEIHGEYISLMLELSGFPEFGNLSSWSDLFCAQNSLQAENISDRVFKLATLPNSSFDPEVIARIIDTVKVLNGFAKFPAMFHVLRIAQSRSSLVRVLAQWRGRDPENIRANEGHFSIVARREFKIAVLQMSGTTLSSGTIRLVPRLEGLMLTSDQNCVIDSFYDIFSFRAVAKLDEDLTGACALELYGSNRVADESPVLTCELRFSARRRKTRLLIQICGLALGLSISNLAPKIVDAGTNGNTFPSLLAIALIIFGAALAAGSIAFGYKKDV